MYKQARASDFVKRQSADNSRCHIFRYLISLSWLPLYLTVRSPLEKLIDLGYDKRDWTKQSSSSLSRRYEATSSYLLGFVYLSRQTNDSPSTRPADYGNRDIYRDAVDDDRYRCGRILRLGLEIATSQKKKKKREREKLIHLARNMEEIKRRIAHRFRVCCSKILGGICEIFAISRKMRSSLWDSSLSFF